MQKEGDSESQASRQVGRIEHAKLFSLLFAFQVCRHRRVIAFFLQFVVGIQRRLVTASQFLILLLDGGTGLDAILIQIDLFPDLFLFLRFRRDHQIVVMDLGSKLLDLRWLDRSFRALAAC